MVHRTPGGVLSPKLSEITKAWTYSTVHHCDLFCRLSGPVLLKLRNDMMDALTHSKLNKFSLLMRMTFRGNKLQTSDVLDEDSPATESTTLREDYKRFAEAQVTATPMMAAELHPLDNSSTCSDFQTDPMRHDLWKRAN